MFIRNVFQALIAIIVVIIGESIIIEMVKGIELPGFIEFLFIIALPVAAILGLISLFRR